MQGLYSLDIQLLTYLILFIQGVKNNHIIALLLKALKIKEKNDKYLCICLVEKIDELRNNEQDLVNDAENVLCRKLTRAETVFKKTGMCVEN